MTHKIIKSLAPLAVMAMTAACLAPVAAQAQQSSPARVAAFAKLPDWSGLWDVEGSPGTFEPAAMPAGGGRAPPGGGAPPKGGSVPEMRDHPPYNAAWEAKYTKMRALSASVADTNTRYCAAGMPRLLASPFDIDISITPEEVLFDHSQREVRHIWTDGRGHPPADELWPLTEGDSIGHWDGQTLVIDTISIKGGLWIDPTAATLSDKAQITERWTQTSPGHLRNEITIVDPVAFTKPWRVVRTYQRSTDNNRFLDDDCYENNRISVGADNKYEVQLESAGGGSSQ